MSGEHFLTNLIDNIENSAATDEGSSLVQVSLRLNEKNAAMLEVFSELNQGKTLLHVFPGQISEALADKLLSDRENADLIEELFEEGALEEYANWRGALPILFNRNAIYMETEPEDLEPPF